MKLSIIILLGIIISLFLIGGCVRERIVYLNSSDMNCPDNTTKINQTIELDNESIDQINETIETNVTEPIANEKEDNSNATEDSMQTLTINEGDLVNLDVEATDPDNNTLIYTFGSPLDSNGSWQTQAGDAGEYLADITVSDGELETNATIKIIVKSVNMVPTIQVIETITVNEGETITLNPIVSDADGDNFTISYSGWMTSSEYTTTYDDAGSYTVVITASDALGSSSMSVDITVENVNRPPVIIDIN